MNFKFRSYEKELLDEDDIPVRDLQQNLEELHFINKWLGGHHISVCGLKQLLANNKEITICEIGCGGGDNITALSNWLKKINIPARFIGIDSKAECIGFAKRKAYVENVDWIVNRYEDVVFNKKPDIIFSSLFCHHFSEPELVYQLNWMKVNSTLGFFINDLHRHWLAYKLIRILTALFSKSHLVKSDAPLSVARGFKKADWQHICKSAGINNYHIKWKWAFRYLIVYKHEK